MSKIPKLSEIEIHLNHFFAAIEVYQSPIKHRKIEEVCI